MRDRCSFCGSPRLYLGSQGAGTLCSGCLRSRARERERMKAAHVQRVLRFLALDKDPHASMRRRIQESPPGEPET